MAETVQITMPQMGESVSEGTVLTWHKQEGDWVEKDETIVEVSTDKVDAEVPAPAAGKLVKILAQEDETVAVGQALAELEPGEASAGRRRHGARRPTAAERPGGEPAPPARRGRRRPPRRSPTATAQHAGRAARRRGARHRPHAGQRHRHRRPDREGRRARLRRAERRRRCDAPRLRPARAPPRPRCCRSAGRTRRSPGTWRRAVEIPTATSFRTFSVATLDAAGAS